MSRFRLQLFSLGLLAVVAACGTTSPNHPVTSASTSPSAAPAVRSSVNFGDGGYDFCGQTQTVPGVARAATQELQPGTFHVYGSYFYLLQFSSLTSCSSGVDYTNSNPTIAAVTHTFYATNHQVVVLEIEMKSAGSTTITATRPNGTKTVVILTNS